MIDGIKTKKIRLPGHDLPLKWSAKVNEQTGEQISRSAWLDGLCIVQKKGGMFARGSLHKFHNKGQHNWDDFLYPAIQSSISRFCGLMNVRPSEVELENLEFGYNLIMNKNPVNYLSALIMHKRQSFSAFSERATRGKSQSKCCVHEDYQIKVYDKGLQYGLRQFILRLEASVNKMRFLKKRGIHIHTLADLKPENFRKLDKTFREIVGEILCCDPIPDTMRLSKSAMQNLYPGREAGYWFSLLPRAHHRGEKTQDAAYHAARTKYYRKRARFVELVEEYGLNQSKREIVSKVDEKSHQFLSSFSGKSVYKITDENVTEKLEKSTQIHREVIEGGSRCLVTGLDISMQKPGSRFLCTTGIRYFMDNKPEIYKRLRERLSSRWLNAPHDVQVKEIHHSIRNEYFNKFHNTRRAINNLYRQPPLFDPGPFISNEKLVLACPERNIITRG